MKENLNNPFDQKTNKKLSYSKAINSEELILVDDDSKLSSILKNYK